MVINSINFFPPALKQFDTNDTVNFDPGELINLFHAFLPKCPLL